MLGISRDFMPVLFGGATVLIGLFVFLAFRTARSKYFRRQPQVNIPQQRTELDQNTGLPQEWSNTSKLANAAARVLSAEDVRKLIEVASAMAGFGPTVNTLSVRDAAVSSMGTDLYGTFLRAFRDAAMLPDDVNFDCRTVDQIANVDPDYLVNRDEMLAFLVRYGMTIKQFYTKNASELGTHLPSAIIMTGTINKLEALHWQFYVNPDSDEN